MEASSVYAGMTSEQIRRVSEFHDARVAWRKEESRKAARFDALLAGTTDVAKSLRAFEKSARGMTLDEIWGWVRTDGAKLTRLVREARK